MGLAMALMSGGEINLVENLVRPAAIAVATTEAGVVVDEGVVPREVLENKYGVYISNIDGDDPVKLEVRDEALSSAIFLKQKEEFAKNNKRLYIILFDGPGVDEKYLTEKQKQEVPVLREYIKEPDLGLSINIDSGDTKLRLILVSTKGSDGKRNINRQSRDPRGYIYSIGEILIHELNHYMIPANVLYPETVVDNSMRDYFDQAKYLFIIKTKDTKTIT
jgi:hypothetical protein